MCKWYFELNFRWISLSVIENEEIIKKILKYPGLWHRKARPPQKQEKSTEIIMDYSESQLSLSDDYLYYDEVFPVEDSDFSGEALSS